MISRKIVIMGLLVLVSMSSFAGREVFVAINNKMLSTSVLEARVSDVDCMYNTDNLDGSLIVSGMPIYIKLENKNSGTCFFKPAKLTLELIDQKRNNKVAVKYNYSVTAVIKVCDGWRRDPLDAMYYSVKGSCGKGAGDISQMTIYVDYAPDVKLTGHLNIVNKPVVGNEKPLKLVGEPKPANNSGHYEPEMPASITNSETIRFLPLVGDYAAVTEFSYGYDDESFCEFSFTWGGDQCLVSSKSSDSSIDESCTATYTVTAIPQGPIVIPKKKVDVTVNNQSSKYPLQLNSLDPSAVILAGGSAPS